MPDLRFSRRAWVVTALCVSVALVSVAGAGARGTQATPYKVMIISGFNTFSNNNPEILQGARAAANAINKRNGLRGRRIEVTECSHQNSVAVDAACARKAVDERFDNVIHRSSFAAGAIPILKAGGVPEIGMVPTLTGDYIRNGNVFPVVTTSQAIFVAAMAYAAKDRTLRRWAAVGVQNSGSNLTLQQTRLIAQKNGRQFVGAFAGPIVASPDMLPTAQRLSQSQADVVVCSCPVPTHIALNAAMNQLGWFPKVYLSNTPTLTVAVLGQFAKLPPTVLGGSDLPPASARSDPLVRQFRADIAAAGFDKEPVNYSGASQVGWIAMYALRGLADRLPKGAAVTRQALVRVATRTTRKNPINLFKVIKWTPGTRGPAAVPNDPNGLAFANKFVGGDWVLAQNAPIDAWQYLGIARK